MTTEELVQGKGRRIEWLDIEGAVHTGTLMSKSPTKCYTAFYVRPDGETQRLLVTARNFNKFV
jgi:hypothetical protein